MEEKAAEVREKKKGSILPSAAHQEKFKKFHQKLISPEVMQFYSKPILFFILCWFSGTI